MCVTKAVVTNAVKIERFITVTGNIFADFRQSMSDMEPVIIDLEPL